MMTPMPGDDGGGDASRAADSNPILSAIVEGGMFEALSHGVGLRNDIRPRADQPAASLPSRTSKHFGGLRTVTR